MKPSITRHILRTSNGLVVEMFFDEETATHGIHARTLKPGKEAIKRALPELAQWRLGIIHEWARRTGRDVSTVMKQFRQIS